MSSELQTVPGGAAVPTETATASQAAAAGEMVKARIVAALHRPRHWETVRERILMDCKRPAFAQEAIYSRPVGTGKAIEGLSIRAAECVARNLGNMDATSEIVYEDADKVLVKVQALDLETNAAWSKNIRISKTVERRKVKRGQQVLAERENSYGDTVYVVRADDADLMTKMGAEISKASRDCVLRLLPGDIRAEMEQVCRETQKAHDAEDPEAAKKRILDSFIGLGVRAAELAKYIGHPLDQCTPAELKDLRGVYTSLQTGEDTWASILKAKTGEGDDGPQQDPLQAKKGAEKAKGDAK